MTPELYAAGRHILASRRGLDKAVTGIDVALGAIGLEREIVTTVGGFSSALALARASDLVASVPERHTSVFTGRNAQLSAAVSGAADHGISALASAAPCRPCASLAARLHPGGMRLSCGLPAVEV